MKRILINVGVVLLVIVLPIIAIICAQLVEEFLFKRAFGWEGNHGDFILFIFMTLVSYASFNYFSERVGRLTIWISITFLIILLILFFLYQNTVKFTIKLAPFYITMFLGLLTGDLLSREGTQKLKIFLILGLFPFILSLGINDLWVHRIEYGNWTGDVSSSEVIPFSFTDKAGNEVDQTTLKGKIVLFDFWFISCGPCWRKFPLLQEMYTKYREHPDVRIFAVNRPMKRDEPGALFSTIEEKEYTFPVLKGNQDDLDDLGVYKYPTVMLLDKDGLIVFMGEHEEAERKLETMLNRE